MKKKIKEWFQGYSELDVNTAITKWSNALFANESFVEMTKREMTAIRKRGICISNNNGTFPRSITPKMKPMTYRENDKILSRQLTHNAIRKTKAV